MDYYNSPDLKNYNTILYGHNMRDGSMFAKLKEYKNPETLAVCPIFLDQYASRGLPVSDIQCPCGGYSRAALIPSGFRTQRHTGNGWKRWSAASEVETGAELNESETVVTLSTCTGDSAIRQVVQGIRITEN